MRYDLDGMIDGEEHIVRECLSYEDFIDAICDSVILGYEGDLILKRRCCGSVWKRTLTNRDANILLETARRNSGEDLRHMLFLTIEKWYMKGEMPE